MTKQANVNFCNRQDIYRNAKIDMVAEFIKVMRRQKVIKQLMVQLIIYNMLIKYRKRYEWALLADQHKYSSTFIAIKFKCKYKVWFKNRYG